MANGKDIPDENPVALRRPLRLEGGERPHTLANNIMEMGARINALDSDTVALGRSMITGFVAVERKVDVVNEKVDALSGKMDVLLSLPPMRRREDSVRVMDETARTVSTIARERAQQIIEDPDEDLTPTAVQNIAEEAVKQALLEQKKADHLHQLEAAAAKAEADRKEALVVAQRKKEARSKFIAQVVSGIIVGLVILAATAYVARMQGRQVGHDEGFEEGRRPTSAVSPSGGRAP